jgi:hypothetical protein
MHITQSIMWRRGEEKEKEGEGGGGGGDQERMYWFT